MDPERGQAAPRSSPAGQRGHAARFQQSPQGEKKSVSSASQESANSAAFWLLGLLNNSAYVIMIACANQISSGAVGLTYLFGILPSLLVKLTGPYWLHLLSYSTRSWIIAGLMAASYMLVAMGDSLGAKLFGVAASSLQGGLGEASCLALASFYDSRTVITYWSSGTGFAGVFGYTWVALLNLIIGLSFRKTLMLANVTAAAWLAVYYLLLQPPSTRVGSRQLPLQQPENGGLELAADVPRDILPEDQVYPLLTTRPGLGTHRGQSPGQGADLHPSAKTSRAKDMDFRERWRRTLVLWPYIAPLALVYFAEYSMQAGAWAAIGFPVTDRRRRDTFYSASNWCYQLGVFVSRSSGLIFQADITALWAMPVVQVGLLIFFVLDAWLHFWYNYGLLVLCLLTGLLGGAVYVNAFTLISRDIESKYREFSLSAASLGDSLGIAIADVAGVLIQGCLYRVNELEGAAFTC